MVAKSKKVKDEKSWVDKILKHCEIHSDYIHFVNLKSNPCMWFGVSDARFECQPFVVFRQLKNNDFEKEVREFEIYTFEGLQDNRFKSMLEDSYGAWVYSFNEDALCHTFEYRKDVQAAYILYKELKNNAECSNVEVMFASSLSDEIYEVVIKEGSEI